MKTTGIIVSCVVPLLCQALVLSAAETNAPPPGKLHGDSRKAVEAGGAGARQALESVLVLPENKPVKVPGFRGLKTGAPARAVTGSTLRWDRTGLEAVFDCADTAILADQQGRDNFKLWKDDCVYVWLYPGHVHGVTSNMVMVQVTAGGVLHDNRNKDWKIDIAGVETEVTRTGAGWRARVKVPWKGLDVPCPSPGDVWCINLSRVDYPGKYDYNAMEQSSWMTVPDGEVTDDKQWANVIFAGANARPDDKEMLAAKSAVEDLHKAEQAESKAKIKAKRLAIEPANPNASPDAYRLLKYLATLPEKPDKRVLIGQSAYTESYEKYVDALARSTGKYPALLEVGWQIGGGRATDIASNNRMLIEHWKAGGLVSIMINLINPFNPSRELWEDRPVTRGSVADVLKPGTPANAIWRGYLGRIAWGLAQLRDAGVVVLWRPLHEMTFRECYWYDIGASYPDAEPYKNLWKDMFNYLTYEKGLNNLLWVYSVANTGGEEHGCIPADIAYPGDDYVDIVGLSVYGNDVQVRGLAYDQLNALGKPFAFGEFGPEGFDRSWDNLRLVEAIRNRYPATIYALYWGSWGSNLMTVVENKNADRLLNDPLILNRGELDWKGIAVPDSWVHPPRTDIKADVVGDTGMLGRIPLKRGSINLQGEPGGLQSAGDLKMTREQGGKTFQGTVMCSNTAVKMVQRVSEKNGGLQIDLEGYAEGRAPEVWYTLQVPTTRFAGGTYAADRRTGTLPKDPLPEGERKFFEGKVGKVSFTAPGGLKLGFELEPEADLYIQDSRKWSPNFSMPIVVRPDGSAKGGKTKLTIRLSVE